MISTHCVELVKQFEGFYSKPYLCPAGVPTIGYGTTIYPDTKKKVRLIDKPISSAVASEYLQQDLYFFAKDVVKLFTAKLNQYQIDALVSFAYNVGIDALRGSSLRAAINRGEKNDRAKITALFGLWNKARVNGKLTVLNGLTRRRAAEANLFFKGGVK